MQPQRRSPSYCPLHAAAASTTRGVRAASLLASWVRVRACKGLVVKQLAARGHQPASESSPKPGCAPVRKIAVLVTGAARRLLPACLPACPTPLHGAAPLLHHCRTPAPCCCRRRRSRRAALAAALPAQPARRPATSKPSWPTGHQPASRAAGARDAAVPPRRWGAAWGRAAAAPPGMTAGPRHPLARGGRARCAWGGAPRSAPGGGRGVRGGVRGASGEGGEGRWGALRVERCACPPTSPSTATHTSLPPLAPSVGCAQTPAPRE